MEIIYKKLKDLKEYKNNNKKHPKEQVERIKLAIKTSGFDVPLKIDKENNIIAGHGRKLACEELGIKEVPCIIKDKLSAGGIISSRIMDNKSAESEFNFDAIRLDFKKLDDLDYDLELTGFNIDEINEIKGLEEEQEEEQKEEPRQPFNDERDNMDIKTLLEQYELILINFSSGKDSIAQLQYILNLGIDKSKIKLVCIDVPFDFPDLPKYRDYLLKEFFEIEYIVLKTESDYEDMIERYGFPSRMNKWCNSTWKVTLLNKFHKSLIKDNIKFITCIGTRADESPRRAKMLDKGVWGKTDFIFPVFDFSDDDIVKIINDNNIPIFYTYKYFNRLSCFVCPEDSKKYFKTLYKNFPDLYIKGLNYMVKGLSCEAYRNTFAIDQLKNISDLDDVQEEEAKFKFNNYYENK